jgi:hypothetical protein
VLNAERYNRLLHDVQVLLARATSVAFASPLRKATPNSQCEIVVNVPS